MAISANTQAIWTLESTLADGGIHGNDLIAVGGTPTYERFQSFDLLESQSSRRYGLQFDSDVVFDAGSNFDFEAGSFYACVIDFWWTSEAALGRDRHLITRQLTPNVAPIIAKANSSISSGIESLTDAEFIISEIGVSKTQNAIRLALSSDGTSITDTIESSAYSPGLHHVYVAYTEMTAATGHARVDIDGQKGDVCIVGGLSARAGSSVRINDIGYGYTTHKTTSTGSILGDMFLSARQSGVTFDGLMINLFRFGWVWGADTDYNSAVASYNGISYHQPSTVSTNQIFVEGGNVFAARSNGELVKGFQPIWDTEFDYKNSSSLNLLTTSEIDEERTVTWTPEGVRLEGTTIRI